MEAPADDLGLLRLAGFARQRPDVAACARLERFDDLPAVAEQRRRPGRRRRAAHSGTRPVVVCPGVEAPASCPPCGRIAYSAAASAAVRAAVRPAFSASAAGKFSSTLMPLIGSMKKSW